MDVLILTVQKPVVISSRISETCWFVLNVTPIDLQHELLQNVRLFYILRCWVTWFLDPFPKKLSLKTIFTVIRYLYAQVTVFSYGRYFATNRFMYQYSVPISFLIAKRVPKRCRNFQFTRLPTERSHRRYQNVCNSKRTSASYIYELRL